MSDWKCWLILSALAIAPSACDGGKATLDPAAREALKQEIKAELLAELEADHAAHRATAPPVLRPALSPGERAAIAAARGHNRTGEGDTPPAATAKPSETGTAKPDAGLTADDTAALRDDPASGGGLGIADDVVGGDAPAPAEGHEVRPGALVWDTPSPVKLIDLAVATGIADRLPQGVAERYDSPPELFFCYTVFDSRDAEVTVTHVWRRGPRLVSRVELEVGKSPRWRTWSRQRTRPDWTGPWSCEVLDPAGERLGLVTFEVGGGN